jgi:hypothetical protein
VFFQRVADLQPNSNSVIPIYTNQPVNLIPYSPEYAKDWLHLVLGCGLSFKLKYYLVWSMLAWQWSSACIKRSTTHVCRLHSQPGTNLHYHCLSSVILALDQWLRATSLHHSRPWSLLWSLWPNLPVTWIDYCCLTLHHSCSQLSLYISLRLLRSKIGFSL